MDNSFFKIFITNLFLKVLKLKYILILFSPPLSPFVYFPLSYHPTSSSFSKNRQKYNTAATTHQKIKKTILNNTRKNYQTVIK